MSPDASTSSRPPAQTPEARQAEIDAKRAERRARKAHRGAQAQAGATAGPEEGLGGPSGQPLFLRRDWIQRPNSTATSASPAEARAGRGDTVRVISWNILAQSLVRRELFPGSDCLKWPVRSPGLLAELAHYAKGLDGSGSSAGGGADFICLQECDRLPALMPSVPNHGCISARGRGKQHGLVILFSESRWSRVADKVVYLDEEELDLAGPSPLTLEGSPSPNDEAPSDAGQRAKVARRRRGGTRETRNVGLVGAFQRRPGADGAEASCGVFVATTHLFWHPNYSYERARQLIVLIRAIRSFQRSVASSRPELGAGNWPVVFAGDFNTTPGEAVYQMFTSPVPPSPAAGALSPSFSTNHPEPAPSGPDDRAIHPVWHTQLLDSQVVHQSLDRVEANLTPAEDGAEALRQALEAWDPIRAGQPTSGQPQTRQGEGAGSAAHSLTGETGSGTPVASAEAGSGSGSGSGVGAAGGEDDEGAPDKDKAGSNIRPPTAEDGLASPEALHGAMWALFHPSSTASDSASPLDPALESASDFATPSGSMGPSEGSAGGLAGASGARSAYTAWDWTSAPSEPPSEGPGEVGRGEAGGTAVQLGREHTFEGRGGYRTEEFKACAEEELPRGTTGQGEPGYTCYTGLFHLTLDYIFVLPPLLPVGLGHAPSKEDRRGAPAPEVQVRALLRPARADELFEGLPKKGVCSSDHLAVGAELEIYWA